MPLGAFEWSDSLSEFTQRLVTRLEGGGIDPSIIDLISLRSLTRTLELRDDDVVAYLNSGLRPSMLHVARAAVQSIVTATPTAISWDTQDLASSTDATWSAGTNPTRVTFNADGIYDIVITGLWAAAATGIRDLAIRKNGATTINGSTAPATATVTPKCSVPLQFNAVNGDYLEGIATQDSGGNLNVTGLCKVIYRGNST